MYLLNKCMQIHHLFHCMHQHKILCLCTWQCNTVLFIRAPSDGSCAHVEWVSGNQIPMWLPSLVCITKSIQDHVSTSTESQPEVLHVAKVCNYIFSSHLPSGLVPDFEWIETGFQLQMPHPGVRLLQATGDIWLPVYRAHLTFKILVLGLMGSDPYWMWLPGPSAYWLILHC